MVLLDFGGGLRRGEVAGVRWEDIDFERGQVLPKRSIVSQVVGETKTEASSKPIPLDDSLLQNGMGSQGGAGTAASCQSENYHGHLHASSLAREAQSSSRGDPNGGSRLVPACDKWLMPSLYLVETKMAGTTGLEPAASAVTALRE